MKRNDVDLNLMPNVIAARCFLHNVCELQRDLPVDPPQSSTLAKSCLSQPHGVVFEGKRPNTAQLIHNTITDNLTAMYKSAVLSHYYHYAVFF